MIIQSACIRCPSACIVHVLQIYRLHTRHCAWNGFGLAAQMTACDATCRYSSLSQSSSNTRMYAMSTPIGKMMTNLITQRGQTPFKYWAGGAFLVVSQDDTTSPVPEGGLTPAAQSDLHSDLEGYLSGLLCCLGPSECLQETDSLTAGTRQASSKMRTWFWGARQTLITSHGRAKVAITHLLRKALFNKPIINVRPLHQCLCLWCLSS